MKPFVIGTRHDVAGFALAGVEGVTASSREGIESEIARAGTDDTIFIVSSSVARVISDHLEQWAKSGLGPLLVVLPEA